VAIASLGACGGETVEETITAEQRGAVAFEDVSLGRVGNAVSCADCHDTSGAIGATGKAGAPLGGVVERPSYWGGQEEDLLGAVNHCLFWFMGRSAPLAADDPEGIDLFAYLESLPASEAGTAAQPFTIGEVLWPGEGDPGRGEEVYARSCGTCHGAIDTGEGRQVNAAPRLPGDTLAAHPPGDYTDEERRLVFVQKVRHGPFFGYGGTMPPFSTEVLPDAALADLLAYLDLP
jgi:thiosulfate dehydrogenase